jgi:glyoxylase-like metal-dependent hydrolase (beta-lactamase superfamily II)
VKPNIMTFYHTPSSTMTYVVSDPATKTAAIIDPVYDFDLPSGQVSVSSINEVIEYINEQSLVVQWILETHAHADHLSSAQYLKQHLGGTVAIGKGITNVQKTFKQVLNLPGFATDGSQFDQLLVGGDRLPLGDLAIKVLATPGHTNDSMTYVIGKNAFIGDTLFMPDSGTARCDFPGGDAGLLFDSIEKIFALGDEVNLWICHDYQPGGRALKYKTTVANQKASNIHLANDIDKTKFVHTREERDATLAVPKLLYPAVQVNICAGNLPEPEVDEQAFVKIPVSLVGCLS